MSAAGGVEPFLERYAVVLCADHGQSPDRPRRRRPRRVRGHAPVSRPRRTDPDECDLAVAASNRAGARLPAREPDAASRDRRAPARTTLGRRRSLARGRARRRSTRGPRAAVRARRPAAGRPWAARGRSRATARPSGSRATATWSRSTYPNALERLWQILGCVNAGDVVASAAPGYEFRDAGGASHLGGGSHGSLHAVDSLVPLGCCRRARTPPRDCPSEALDRGTSQHSVRASRNRDPGDPSLLCRCSRVAPSVRPR